MSRKRRSVHMACRTAPSLSGAVRWPFVRDSVLGARGGQRGRHIARNGDDPPQPSCPPKIYFGLSLHALR